MHTTEHDQSPAGQDAMQATNLARGVYRVGHAGPNGERLLYAVDHRGLMVDWRYVHRRDAAQGAMDALWATLDRLDPLDTEEEAGAEVETVTTNRGGRGPQ